MLIGILNVKGQNTHHGGYMSSGAFGSIYSGQFNNKIFVIKCLPVWSNKSRIRAIKEVFLMRFCSHLKIGPKINNYMGFDMLMFSECI